MDQTKIIIESLLTGSQFELSINEHDKISIVKSNIQKILGIPSNQLHLLHNQIELNDSMLLKDIPNFHEGSKLKLKLVLGMKVGPISSQRRVPIADYDSWFDDVMHQNSKREEPLTIKTKYLVYKGCKKNVHRLWKMNGSDSKGKSTSGHNNKYGKSTNSLFGSMSGRDDEKIKKMTDQTIQENIRTTEKVNQLRLKMELVNARKKLKSIKFPLKSKNNNKMMLDINTSTGISDKLSKQINDSITKELNETVVENKPLTAPVSSTMSLLKTKDNNNDKVIQKQQIKHEGRNLSAESKMKIKENLSRNRSFKTILNQPTISASTSSMSLFNNDINPLEFCFSTGTNSSDIFGPTSSGNKLGRSLSFQSNYILNRTDSNLCVNALEAATISNSSPIIQEYVEHICEPSSSTAAATAVGTKIKDQLPKSNYSTSMQDLLLQEFLTKSSPNSACSHFHHQLTASTSARDFPSANNSGSALKLAADEKIDMFKGTAITKMSPGDEYFILPKLLIREDSPPVLESLVVKESKTEDLLDVATGKQPSAESLIEFYENLTSSSTSSLTSSKINDFECFHQPTNNRFYHSDLDLNQLNNRFKNNLSISNQNINTSEGNLGADSDWTNLTRSNLLLLSINQTLKDEPQSDYNLIEDVNYDKFLNDLLNNDSGNVSAVLGSDSLVDVKKDCESNEIVENIKKNAFSDNISGTSSRVVSKDNNSEMIDLFGGDNVLTKKMTSRRIAPLKKPIDKLKSFSSNPQLGNHNTLSTHESSNLATTTSTTTVHIPQLSRLDAIPTKYRRGYINLNDACLSNSDLSTTASTTKLPKTCDRKSSLTTKDLSSFHHGASIFHCRSNQNDRIPQPPTFDYFDGCTTESNSSGRQSRFEYCNSYYSNLNQFASSSSANRKSSDVSNFDFQSEENLFNMNFDSFYEDFVDSAELSWSSSSSSTSFDSSSISSMYDKKYVILPEIKLDNNNELKADDKALMVAKEKVDTSNEVDGGECSNANSQQQKESTGKLRCFHCNKKLGIIMVMKCHCNQYFCSAHRYKEVHNCSYDYKENGRKQLERENPLVCTQKLPKI